MTRDSGDEGVAKTDRPNVLIILTDQQRAPPVYESDALRRFRHDTLTAERSLRESGVSLGRHYIMSAACTPSRTSLFTGHYPSLHGVTQTDGLAKSAHGAHMTWLAHDTVPTMGDWFRAGGYRTFYKGKWHVSHAELPAPGGDGPLQTLKGDGTVLPENVDAYLKADLLDAYGFSEWVGPEPHGLGPQNTGTVRDPFTASEVIDLLRRLDREADDRPWLTVCSFLNPHDIALFGVTALTQGLRYDRGPSIPPVANAPTRHEDLSTKPTCQQSYVDVWGKMLAPQPWIAAHRRYYFQVQRTVDALIGSVLDALRATRAHDDTIVVFSSDHGDMLGAHGGMHQKWHNAYEETTHVPFIVAGPPIKGPAREISIPTSHADLLPTLLGLAGIDQDAALTRVAADHKEARPLVGRDLSRLIMGAGEAPADPVFFMTDDEISEGEDKPGSPVQRVARKMRIYSIVAQPNHVETVVAEADVDGARHLVKFSRYHDNAQFWTEPGVEDRRLKGRKTEVVTQPSPDEFELYDLTLDPQERINLAHPANATEQSRKLRAHMLGVLTEQLAKKRLTPASGVKPGYRPPTTA